MKKLTSTVSSQGKNVTVAALQFGPVLGDKEINIRTSIEQIERAVDTGAELVVLPELCNTGYHLNDYKEALLWGEEIPSGRTVTAWAEVAKRRNVYIIAGLLEREGNKYFNSAVVIGPDGFIGTYRKTHLFGREKLFFQPGDCGLPIFNLPFGRIGVLICYDLRFFETIRILTLLGADLICVPTNWVLGFDTRVNDNYIMHNYVAMTAANINQVFIACASRVGSERGTTYLGRSIIVGPSGWPIQGPASPNDQDTLIANLELGEAITGKIKSSYNDVLRDRRIDLYANLLGYSLDKPYQF